MGRIPSINKEKRRALLSLALVTPAGFVVKYALPAAVYAWGFRYGGAVLYEIFWVLIARLFRRHWSPLRCGVTVFVLTSLLEVLQLWHPSWLEVIRATFPGAVLLGSHFDMNDFIYYLLGCVLGWLWLKAWIVKMPREEMSR